MADFHPPSLAHIGLGLIALYLVYTIILRVHLYRKRESFKRVQGVQEAKWMVNNDHYIGLKNFLDNTQALKEHRLLAQFEDKFREAGARTLQFSTLGRHAHVTIEPENLKVIQAIDFKKWGLSERRITAFRPLLGNGRLAFLDT